MARSKVGLSGEKMIESKPKKTRQGSGKNTKYTASSRNGAKKRYRGQGRWYILLEYKQMYGLFDR